MRSAVADWITIFTGLITMGAGIYSLPSNVDQVSNDVGLSDYVTHSVTSLVCFITLVFFTDQSIRISRILVLNRTLVLPNWSVYTLCHVGGVLFFITSQVLFQAKVFNDLNNAYIVVPLLAWGVFIFVNLMEWDSYR